MYSGSRNTDCGLLRKREEEVEKKIVHVSAWGTTYEARFSFEAFHNSSMREKVHTQLEIIGNSRQLRECTISFRFRNIKYMSITLKSFFFYSLEYRCRKQRNYNKTRNHKLFFKWKIKNWQSQRNIKMGKKISNGLKEVRTRTSKPVAKPLRWFSFLMENIGITTECLDN